MRRSNNQTVLMSPLLWGITIILILLLVALSFVLFLLSNERASNPNPVAGIVADVTSTPIPPPPTDPPPTVTNTPPPPPVATVEPTATTPPTAVPTEEPAETEVEENPEAEVDEVESSEPISDTTTISDTVAVTDTVDITTTTLITETEALTETVTVPNPNLVCEAGPLESADGCVYDVSIGLDVVTGGIHDWYLNNTGTCDVPANHKLIEVSSGLATVNGLTEYTIGGEYFPVGHTVPEDVDITVDEPPFIFLNFAVPEEPGVYESCWRLADENNIPYGQPLITTITVEEQPPEEEGETVEEEGGG